MRTPVLIDHADHRTFPFLEQIPQTRCPIALENVSVVRVHEHDQPDIRRPACRDDRRELGEFRRRVSCRRIQRRLEPQVAREVRRLHLTEHRVLTVGLDEATVLEHRVEPACREIRHVGHALHGDGLHGIDQRVQRKENRRVILDHLPLAARVRLTVPVHEETALEVTGFPGLRAAGTPGVGYEVEEVDAEHHVLRRLAREHVPQVAERRIDPAGGQRQVVHGAHVFGPRRAFRVEAGFCSRVAQHQSARPGLQHPIRLDQLAVRSGLRLQSVDAR